MFWRKILALITIYTELEKYKFIFLRSRFSKCCVGWDHDHNIYIFKLEYFVNLNAMQIIK